VDGVRVGDAIGRRREEAQSDVETREVGDDALRAILAIEAEAAAIPRGQRVHLDECYAAIKNDGSSDCICGVLAYAPFTSWVVLDRGSPSEIQLEQQFDQLGV
jgi:predicted RecA/RadA family phage recombinase